MTNYKINELNYLPPLKIGLNEKMEYNRVAVKLNRQIEKRRLQEYAEDMSMISSSEDLLVDKKNVELRKDSINYQRIIDNDYPSFSDHEINFFVNLLKFRAESMGIKLSDKQLS